MDSIKYYDNHQSIKIIRDNFDKCKDFKFSTVVPDMVHGVIHSLDKSKATGYDGLSVKILKIASPVLCLPLTNLFNKCIITSEFPKQLKRANVSPFI